MQEPSKGSLTRETVVSTSKKSIVASQEHILTVDDEYMKRDSDPNRSNDEFAELPQSNLYSGVNNSTSLPSGLKQAKFEEKEKSIKSDCGSVYVKFGPEDLKEDRNEKDVIINCSQTIKSIEPLPNISGYEDKTEDNLSLGDKFDPKNKDETNTDHKLVNKITYESKYKCLLKEFSIDVRRAFFFDQGLVNAMEKVKKLLLEIETEETEEKYDDSSFSSTLLEIANKNNDVELGATNDHYHNQEHEIKIQKETAIITIPPSSISSDTNRDDLEIHGNLHPESEILIDSKSSNATLPIEKEMKVTNKNNKSTNRVVENVDRSTSHFNSKVADADLNDTISNSDDLYHESKQGPKSDMVYCSTDLKASSQNTPNVTELGDVGCPPIRPPRKHEMLGQSLKNVLQNAEQLMLKAKENSSIEQSDKNVDKPDKLQSLSSSNTSIIEHHNLQKDTKSTFQSDTLSTLSKNEPKSEPEICKKLDEGREQISDASSTSVSTGLTPKRDEKLDQSLDNILQSASLLMLKMKTNTSIEKTES